MAFDQLGDEELAERFQSGDAAAFTEIFRRHQPAVARVVARMLGTTSFGRASVTELEDLVQDVFVQVYRSLDSFRGQARLGTWIYRIAVNVVLMYRRSARSRPIFAQANDSLPPVAQTRGPEDELLQRRKIEALYRHLGLLSEKKRTVYILHEIEGLSPAEIGKIVGAPVLTVRTRLFYARRELMASFKADPYLSSLVEQLEQPEKFDTESYSKMRMRTSSEPKIALEATSREKLS